VRGREKGGASTTGAGIREAAQLGAAALEVVAFGGAAPTGGGAKEGIKALTETENKSKVKSMVYSASSRYHTDTGLFLLKGSYKFRISIVNMCI
jgi:hypothetical protein